MLLHNPNSIHQPIMLILLKQYTRLKLDSSGLHIIWSNSADACTCGGYLCSPPSCSPPSYVLQVLQWINPPHTRL